MNVTIRVDVVPDFTNMDYFAVFWFALCWTGYTFFADHRRFRPDSMAAAMDGYRRRWMFSMLHRENRVFDSTLLGNLLNGAAFFASTTIFAVGGLLAALGAADRAVSILADLPITVATSRTGTHEVKYAMTSAIVPNEMKVIRWSQP